MKLNKMLVCLALVGLGATSCTPRNRANGGICGGSTAGSTTGAGDNTGAGLKFDTKDPYSGVLSGLDKTKAPKDYSGNISYEGYVGDDDYCYGWEDYTVEAWGGAKYGVAVKLKFNEIGAVEDLEIGAPEEGYTNFSSNYGDGSIAAIGQEIYLTKYLKSEKANVLAAIKGKSAAELMHAFAGLKCDDTGSEGMDKWTTCKDEAYNFMGTGATQTNTRLQLAIAHACIAYVNSAEGYNAYDPFYNNGRYLITEETQVATAKAMMEVAGEAEKAITGHAIKTSEYQYVGFAAYQVPAWYSYYGAGVRLTVNEEKTIVAADLGYPFDVQSAWHNFTPSYIQTNPSAYFDYVMNSQDRIDDLLIGKTVNSELLQKVNAATMVIPANGKEGGSQDAKNATQFVTEGGATQTNARINLAITAALTEILK